MNSLSFLLIWLLFRRPGRLRAAAACCLNSSFGSLTRTRREARKQHLRISGRYLNESKSCRLPRTLSRFDSGEECGAGTVLVAEVGGTAARMVHDSH